MKYKPIIPMGAITGKPTRNDLHRNLESYRNAGIDQFMIYARSGLELEYMESEWIEVCRHIIEYCAEHDMAVWLYDEYNWPSGKCKGKVIKADSNFASKKLVAFKDRNFMGDEQKKCAEEEYYWTKVDIPLYADLLNPDAVDCFIKLTHDVYYQHFGQYFGSTIKGFFTDEPSFMYAGFHPVSGSVLEVPYYEEMEVDYQQRTGRKLLADFEQYLSGNVSQSLWSDFYLLLGERFRNVFIKKIRTWCDTKGVLFTGHLMSEYNPFSAIQANGDPVGAIRSFSMPGIDEIRSSDSFEDLELGTFKLLESAAAKPGSKAIAELFAMGPSDMTLAKMRQMIYLSALHGANHFVTAVSALDARGNVFKPYYYNPIAPTQPWFHYIAQLNEEAESAAALTEKQSTASIAIRYPQEIFCLNWNHAKNPSLKIDYIALMRELLNAQWEFRVIGSDEIPDTNYSVVLDLNAEGVVEEYTAKQMANIKEVLKFLAKKLKRRAVLKDKNGDIVEKILLKTFDDGATCIVNTSGKNLKDVSLNGINFDMPIHDVKIFPNKQEISGKTLELKSHSFFCRLENDNTLRPMFIDKKNIKFESEIDTNVILHLREYNGPVEMKLDDASVIPCGRCNILPDGLKSLYVSSPLIKLKKGKHKLEILTETEELPYLPLLLISGNFAVSKNKVIKSLPEKAVVADFFQNCLNQYAGTVIMEDVLDLCDYDNLAFDYKEMSIEIFLDNCSLGPRLWMPYLWAIPQEFKRKNVKVKIKITTSIGPIFADYPRHLKGDVPAWFSDFWPGDNNQKN